MDDRTSISAERLEALRRERGVSPPPPRSKPRESSTSAPCDSPSSSLEEIEARQARYRRMELWDAARFPRRHRERLAEHPTWPDGLAEKAWVMLAEQRGCVALIGPRGSGKTQLATYLAWHLVHDIGMSAAYTRADDFFESVRREFDDGGKQGAVLARLVRVGLLVMDELQDRKVESQFERQEFNRLIDKRYSACLPTILIGNETPEAFAANVGPSIVSRMQEGGGMLVVDLPSFRDPQNA